MPFDPRSTRPSRTYRATPRDATGAALFWLLVVIVVLGAWVFAGSFGTGGGMAIPEQRQIVVPDDSPDNG
ncbi:MAG: hypothetical protein AAGA28_12400 [Pseudomonadota bacterium]